MVETYAEPYTCVKTAGFRATTNRCPAPSVMLPNTYGVVVNSARPDPDDEKVG